MTVKELIVRLEKMPQDATVVMCMDWTKDDVVMPAFNSQWEDNLGDLAIAGPTAKHVYLLNENFK